VPIIVPSIDHFRLAPKSGAKADNIDVMGQFPDSCGAAICVSFRSAVHIADRVRS
jgi:hypothetical protein